MFHIWLPYVHGAAPTPISALLSPAMIGIGAYGIFRLIVEFLPATFADLVNMVLHLGTCYNDLWRCNGTDAR